MSRAVLVAIAVAVVTATSPFRPTLAQDKDKVSPPPKAAPDTEKDKEGVSLLPKGAEKREKAWAPNLSQAFLRSKEEKKPMAVLFGADWAFAHMRLRREFFDTPAFDKFVDKGVFVIGNPEKDDKFDNVKKKMQELGIDSFPTLVVMDEKLMEIDRITGRWDTDIYGPKLEAVFRNVEAYRKTGQLDFGENAGDKFHPHRLAALLAAEGKADVAKLVLDPKDRLTEDRLHALILQTSPRATRDPRRGKGGAQMYDFAIKGVRASHGLSLEVGEQSIVLRRTLTGFTKADQVPPEAMRRMLQQALRSGAGYRLEGEPVWVQLVLTLDRDITVERFADRVRLYVEDCDEAVTQMMPLLVGTPK